MVQWEKLKITVGKEGRKEGIISGLKGTRQDVGRHLRSQVKGLPWDRMRYPPPLRQEERKGRQIKCRYVFWYDGLENRGVLTYYGLLFSL